MYVLAVLLASLALASGQATNGRRPTLFEQPRPQRPTQGTFEEPLPTFEDPQPAFFDDPLPAPAARPGPRPAARPGPRPPRPIFEASPARPAAGLQSLECPEPYGYFPDAYQCDMYYECSDWVPTEHLCDDGLVFDEYKGKAGHSDPCDSPYVVDCEERSELQLASFPSDKCPRRHGTFADPNVCEKYYTCIEGHHTETHCTTGLHFDEVSGNCAWPALANRQNCTKEIKCKGIKGDMCCDGKPVINDQGQQIPHPAFPTDDCQKFYVCHQGVDPQEASCSLGQVFDPKSMICDYPENVPSCYGWYKDDPRFADYYDGYYYDDVPAGSASNVGNQDTVF